MTQRTHTITWTSSPWNAQVQPTISRQQWLEDWKLRYKYLSQEIRDIKRDHKEAQRTRNGRGYEYALLKLKQRAREMMIERHINKAFYRALELHYARSA